MKAIITVGISASGKSTWAKEFLEEKEEAFRKFESDEEWGQVERDWIRRMIQMDKGIEVGDSGVNWAKWKWKDEKKVTEIFWTDVETAAAHSVNLVISDTNLNADRADAMAKKLRELGYVVEFRFFPISFEEACKRDAKRTNGVGVSVIAKQMEQWNAGQAKKYTPDTSKPLAVIVDVDGTLARMDGRGPFDWSKVSEDKPNHFVIDVVRGLRSLHYTIIVMSGRDGVCYKATQDWLRTHDVPFDYHFQRAMADTRPDTEIKEEAFWKHVANNFNVKFVIDDRPVMVRKWRAMGLETMAVGNQHIDF